MPRAIGDDVASFSAVLDEAVRQLSELSRQSEIRWHDLRHFMLSWSLRLRPKGERDQIVESVNKGKHSERETRENQIMEQTIYDEGVEQGREEGVVIARIQNLESLLSLATTPVRQFRTRSLNELLQIEAELKAKLANRS